MGFFSSKKDDKQPQTCGACGGAGRIQTGSNKWTGATFSTCPTCGGSGTQ